MLILILLLALLLLIALALVSKVVVETEYKDKKFFVVIKFLNFKIFDNSKKRKKKLIKIIKKGTIKKNPAVSLIYPRLLNIRIY